MNKLLVILLCCLTFNACNTNTSIIDHGCNRINQEFLNKVLNSKVFMSSDYSYYIDTTDNNLIRYSLCRTSSPTIISEQYFFNFDNYLVSYFYYNDFQQDNPLLFRADFKNACYIKDSIVFEGSPVSYRILQTDTSNIAYVSAASPFFLKGKFDCIKQVGSLKRMMTKDSICYSNNLWGYGVTLEEKVESKYMFSVMYELENEIVFNDTLSLVLPVGDR